MNIEIEVCERLGDSWLDDDGKRQPKYHACIKDAHGIWSCGRTADEAIGGLIQSHPDYFNVNISYLGTLPR